MEDLRAHGEFMKHSEQIRRDHKNIYNRLKSIEEDASFVSEISELFPRYAIVERLHIKHTIPWLSMTANERCGSWYINPQQNHKRASAYFKSTDGHTGQWKFNLRRMNLHLLEVIQETSGCLIVDSTRRGKRLPDALSKTIPIWCAVINRVISKSQYCATDWDSALYTLPSVISRSEHAQIEILLDGFARNMMNTGVNIDDICKKLKKPLRPIWITPQSTFLDSSDYLDAPFLPVICLSASQFVEGGSQARHGYMYVQGSGDDEEAWSLGLTPQLFWENKEKLLSSNSATCESLAKDIVESSKIIMDRNQTDPHAFSFVGESKIAIGNWSSGKPEECWGNFDVVINCTEHEYQENRSKEYQKRYLHLNIPASKRGQHELFKCISTALEFCKEPIRASKTILIHCAEGKDRSVGIALAILVRYFDTNYKIYNDIENISKVDKSYIQQHLINIMASRPQARPSRATLKKVNTYFMS